MINTDPSEYPAAGYCLFPDLFNAEQVAAMQHGLDLAILASFKGLPNYYGEPHTTEALWLKTCINPKLLDAVELLLGPNLILVYSSMFIKVARDEKIVHWHQDNSYWESVHGTDVLTVWLAIDDVEDDNAPMKVIPGSHLGYKQLEMLDSGKNGFLKKRVDVSPEQEASSVSLTMKAGSLSIHDSHLIHGGDQNTSDRRRAGYTIRFCSTDTAWVDLEKHPIPVYLVRGERGPKGEGYIDLRDA